LDDSDIENYSLSITDSLLGQGVAEDINSLPLEGSGLVTVYNNAYVKTAARDRVFDLVKARIFVAEQASKLLR